MAKKNSSNKKGEGEKLHLIEPFDTSKLSDKEYIEYAEKILEIITPEIAETLHMTETRNRMLATVQEMKLIYNRNKAASMSRELYQQFERIDEQNKKLTEE